MSITRTNAAAGVASGLPFSLAADAGGVCLISGMPALDSDGSLVAGTFLEEAERAWRNVVSVAEAAGYSVQEIVYVQCVLADIGDYSALNDWWGRQFPDVSAAPARFTYQAGGLPFGAKVELQAIAAPDR
jgi:2-iminobutanoate/2-iminopropanoate deaminase